MVNQEYHNDVQRLAKLLKKGKVYSREEILGKITESGINISLRRDKEDILKMLLKDFGIGYKFKGLRGLLFEMNHPSDPPFGIPPSYPYFAIEEVRNDRGETAYRPKKGVATEIPFCFQSVIDTCVNEGLITKETERTVKRMLMEN
jgi:hypothetical protein